MNCAYHQELVSRFVDGELELRLQSELFGHLASCPACQELLDGLVRLKAEIRRERVPYPQELDEAILGGILRSTPGPGTAAAAGQPALPGGGWGRRVTAPLHVAVPVFIVIILAGILLGRMIFPQEAPRPATTRTEEARTLPANYVYGMPPVEIYSAPAAQLPAGSVEPKQ